MFIDVTDKLRIIRVPPVTARMFPRNITGNFHAVCQLVEDNILHIRVVLHNEKKVMQVSEKFSCPLVPLEFLHPFGVAIRALGAARTA